MLRRRTGPRRRGSARCSRPRRRRRAGERRDDVHSRVRHPPDLATISGLSTDGAGRLLTDETLTSIYDLRLVAAGDRASPSGVPLRMSCQMAGPLGMKAADTVLSRIAGTEPEGIDQASFGACISLGRRSGIVQTAHRDDRPIPVSFTGRIVAPIEETVCLSTLWSLRREGRRPGSAFWLTSGRAARRARAEERSRQVHVAPGALTPPGARTGKSWTSEPQQPA